MIRKPENVFRILRRAFNATPDEWHVRIKQKAFREVNRVLASQHKAIFSRNGHLKSLGKRGEELVKWWQQRRTHWFLDSLRSAKLNRFLMANEHLQASIIEVADRIMNDELPLLGYGLNEFRGDNRWRHDPVLGIDAPQAFYGQIQYLDVQEVGDSKRVWEPNRFGWAYWLGMAYQLTRGDGYSEKFRALTLDWFGDNSYPQGVNFCSALELGIRAYAWVWALELFRDSKALDSELLEKLLYGIWVSCRHIENNLSYYFAPNTHLIGEAFALFAVGAAIPEYSESERWRKLGVSILTNEAGHQFHKDGTHRELSSCYHLYATDFYLQAVLISRQTGFAIDGMIEATARKAAIRLAQLAPTDLQLPQFNDCDAGRLSWFCTKPLDAAPTLAAAKRLWDHPAFPANINPCNGYHLWMAPVANRHIGETNDSVKRVVPDASEESVSPTCSQLDSGIAAYRNPAGDFLLFRSGPFGYMDCGHSHDAATSFILYFAGRPLFVDSGTGTYTQSRAERNLFRGALGKNVMLINENGAAVPGDWFSWERKPSANLTRAEPFASGFLFEGMHHAHSDVLGFHVELSRQIVVYDQGVIVIVDHWTSEQSVSCKLALTLHPSIKPTQNGFGVRLDDGDGNEYWLATSRFDRPVEILSGPTLSDNLNSIELVNLARERQSELRGEMGLSTSLPVKTTKVHYSPAYGRIEETDCLECDFGKAKRGCAVTVVSRAGEISKISVNDNAETRFAVATHSDLHSTGVEGFGMYVAVAKHRSVALSYSRVS